MTLLIIFLCILWLFYVVVITPRRLAITKLKVIINNLNLPFTNLTILQLSDLHSDSPNVTKGMIKKAITKANQLNPDLIVLTGDYISWHTNSITPLLQLLCQLKAKYGIYACLGNHDHWIGEKGTQQLIQGLNSIGIKVLINESVQLTINGTTFWLTGIDGNYTPGGLYINANELQKALKGLPEAQPKIVLSHSPDIIEDAAAQKVDLIIAGHTHGGQVNLPLLGPPRPVSRYGRKYTAGYFKVNHTQMYVNHGIGITGIPIRWRCPPEITVYQLTSK